MAFQTVFRRYELKYLLTYEQRDALLRAMDPYMKLDKYGKSTIRNIYYDTDSYRLVRRSIEKPMYKEKLRVRSYTLATEESTVFVELKKKYDGVVYKRRLSLPHNLATDWLAGKRPIPTRSQISEEVEYFLRYYSTLVPAVYLSYDRCAYFCRSGTDFRVTFDENILARTENLTLQAEPYGAPLLQDGYVLLEIKCSGGIPLWMTEFLSANKIYKTSFSKYGRAYEKLIFPTLYSASKKQFNMQNKEELTHV